MSSSKLVNIISLVIIVLALGVYIAVNQRDENQSNTATASFYPLAEFSSRIGGEKFTIRNLIPAGVEPHDFEPTPQNMVQLTKSKLFIYNGGGLETWVQDILPQLDQTAAVNSSEGIELMSTVFEENDSEEGTVNKDPHLWLDPLLARDQSRNILHGFLKVDTDNSAYYQQNADKLFADLNQLDKEFREGLSNCQKHKIITSHAAFSYVSKRYGFEMVPIAGLSPEDEPSAQKLAELTELAKREGLEYVFFESLVSPKLAETLANEVGAKTLALNPIEGLTDSDLAQGKNYFTIQRENLNNLRLALKCQ
jgi:zinc transport system substrate-binding protein